MQAQDGLVHGQAPIVAHRVPVKLIVIGQELRHAIGFVADYEAMVAGRERRPRREPQLRIAGIAALLVGDRRAILGGFQDLDANAGVFLVCADQTPVPARFGIDGQLADHSVAEVIAFAAHDKLFADFEGGVFAQRGVALERDDALALRARWRARLPASLLS